jgi:general secretion pathway protein J
VKTLRPESRVPSPESRQAGFTLLELLVAIAVFAVLSVMAYQGLNSVLNARNETDRHAARLAELQRAFLFVERDLLQIVARPVRDAYGDRQPALITTQVEGGAAIELTRGGWSNPALVNRSQLQRVGYVVRDGALMRLTWRVLDRAPDSAAAETPLLYAVQGLTLRFMDKDSEWHNAWPPTTQQTRQASGAGEPLPRAIEFSTELSDLGRITRILELPQAAPVAPPGQNPGANQNPES